MAMRPQLLAWQWQHYPVGHRDRGNLLLHIVSVPVFYAGIATLITGLTAGAWLYAASGLVAMLAVMIVQGRGHRREASAPIGFLGAGDVVTRLFAEQLVTFPRFVLSGGWARAWREAGATPKPVRDAA
jgi:hypothetical protein